MTNSEMNPQMAETAVRYVVNVTPEVASVRVGYGIRLTASLTDYGRAISGRFTWSSSNTAVATVDPWGGVLGRSNGTVVIRATANGATDSAVVTVGTGGTTAPAPAPVANISVSPATVSLAPGGTQQMTAQLTDASGNVLTDRVVTWSSSNTSIATVSNFGVVVANAAGTATITAISEGRSATAQVTVAAAQTPVATVAVTPATATLQVGATAQLTAVARDAGNNILTGRPVSWSTSNAAVATVSSQGVVTGVAGGTATVTATVEGRTGTSAITVTVPAPAPTVASVSVSPTSASVLVNGTTQLTATARDASGNVVSGQTFVWSSSNPAVATVSSTGLVRGMAAGMATVTATAGGRSGTAGITVTAVTQPPPSGTGTVAFASDWSTELGTSTNARTDGGRWNIMGDPGVGLAVVPTGSLGFPTANVLQVTARESAGGFARLARTGLTVPAAGQSIFYRWYFRNEIPLTGDNSTHPVESGQSGGLDWTFNVQVQTNTTWYPEFRPGGNQNDATRARWTGPILTRGVTYRFELQIDKVSNTQFRAHMRIYDAAGNLIADDADFNNWAGGLYPSTRMTLADNPLLNFSTNGGLNLGEFRAGINSLVANGFGSILYAYQGGFAVCYTGWCGPYRTGEGR